MRGGTAVAPLAAGDTCMAGMVGAEDRQREERKKQVKKKQLRPFLHVPGGLHHLSAPQASAHLVPPAILLCY